jgi:hypothetical protein
VLGHVHETGELLQQRLGIDALERDAVVAPRVATARHPVEAPRELSEQGQHPLEPLGLERGLDLKDQYLEQLADVRRLWIPVELADDVIALVRRGPYRANGGRELAKGDGDLVHPGAAEPCRDVVRAQRGVSGQRVQQLAQLSRRGVSRDHDLAHVVHPDPEHQPVDPILHGAAVHHQAAAVVPQGDGRLPEGVQERPELRLLIRVRLRVAKQLHALGEPCGDGVRVRNRHGRQGNLMIGG